jgi:cytoskeletal protein CcmA (bactofilin family)
MADAVDADDLVQSIPSVGPLTASRPDQMIRRGTDLVDRSRPPRDSGRLSVGRGITLSGEVSSCERLYIEGSVEADLTNCRVIEIAEGGLLKGSMAIDEAEVGGRFEGSLVVRNRLVIKATGRVSGTIRYGRIEIECGGQIHGDVQARTAGEPVHQSHKIPEASDYPLGDD